MPEYFNLTLTNENSRLLAHWSITVVKDDVSDEDFDRLCDSAEYEDIVLKVGELFYLTNPIGLDNEIRNEIKLAIEESGLKEKGGE